MDILEGELGRVRFDYAIAVKRPFENSIDLVIGVILKSQNLTFSAGTVIGS